MAIATARTWLQNLKARCGRVASQPDRSITVLAIDAEATAKALAITTAVQQHYPRAVVQWLDAGQVPHQPAETYPLPFAWRRTTRRFLKRTQTGILIVAGSPTQAVRLICREAWHRGCAIIVVAGFDETRTPDRSRRVDELLEAARAEHVFGFGIATGGYDTGERRLTPIKAGDPAPALAVLAPLLTRSLRTQSLARRGETSPSPASLHGRLLSLKFPRIESLDQLRLRLAEPESILCLGNGPSSEDSGLREVNCERLFRVNVDWQKRGFLTDVDVVFSSLNSAFERLRPRRCFVARTEVDVQHVVKRFRWAPRVIRLASAEQLGIGSAPGFTTHVPSNGAIMLAAAVALRPRRLVVAGIDFFAHPAGAYPGDPTTVNAYSLGHDRDLERACIVSLLRRFEGELIVFGEGLRQALADAGGPSGILSVVPPFESGLAVDKT